jgi:hypothetical protein
MPPLTGSLKRKAAYYGMDWLPDGYPGRRCGEEVWAHPIYGAYALKDYLDQLDRAPTAELRQALRTVAHAAVRRMEPFEDALVFWYEERTDNSRAIEQHYSGLTQGYYAVHLARAGRILDDPALKEAADRVFASLTVGVDRGGICSAGQLGPCIAEVSQEPSSHILNGWLSALAAIGEFAEVTGRADPRALALASAEELARLLPLYDAPVLCNSRYGLSGFVYARLVFRGETAPPLEVGDLRLHLPGEGILAVDRIGGRRWQNHVLEADVRSPARGSAGRFQLSGNLMRINLVLSRISYPQPNRLTAEVSTGGGIVEVQLQRGRYDPLSVSQVDRCWVTVARLDCPPGRSRVDVPLPWDVAELVAYPTNFAKKIDGHQTNVYHVVHINRLRELAAATGVGNLREWADTWLRYLGVWRDMPVYEGLHVSWGRGTAPVTEAGRVLPPAAAELL